VTDFIRNIQGGSDPKESVFIAHNIQFDYTLWRENDARIKRSEQECEAYQGATWYCTKRWAELAKCPANLGDLCKQFNVTNPQAHSALGDVIATGMILPYLAERLRT
jgi:DNA polymerase III alpha subunit (gram-positive type)